LRDKGVISVEHYSPDNRLLRIIEGKDSADIYKKIIENHWITELSHAAYIGKELVRAELSMKFDFKYIQDGA
jgi:tetrahydromethanopterin S-methyltransferase subunit A